MKRTILFSSLLFLILNTAVFGQKDSTQTEKKSEKKEVPALGSVFKPTVGLGTGLLSFYGDLYARHFQPIEQSRIGFELFVSQPLSKSFRLNFYTLFGKLGANERSDLRNENFEAEIRLGGVNVMYDFNHLINPKYSIRPFISLGVESFEFLSKTDLKDASGNTYHYWSDGSIKNLAENDPNAANAFDLVRDYKYESDIRELNKDGFGKYQERSWGIPVGLGVYWDIAERFHFRLGSTMHFTFTDYIDGISNKSVGDRAGTKMKDNFLMTSASLHYDLVIKSKDDTLDDAYFDDVDFFALDKEDRDGDGVNDFDDICHGTPAGAKVDSKGCPVDEDKDMIPDYRDDELPTAANQIADGKGVAIADEEFQNWYDLYFDSTGINNPLVDLDSAKRGKPLVDPRKQKKEFTVELARFEGGVPSDVAAFMLSIEDVKSVEQGESTIIYTAGTYDDIRKAITRRDDFRAEGDKKATIGYFKGDNYYPMSDSEIEKEIDAANHAEHNNEHNSDAHNHSSEVVYRVQLGAYKNKLSPSVFRNIGNIIELITPDGYFRYVSAGYKTLNEALTHRVDLVLEGYPDAFVTAYRAGKRIPLAEAGATFVNKNEKEDLNESNIKTGTIDKNLVTFKVQLGTLKKADNKAFFDLLKDVKDVEQIPTGTGLIRVSSGSFHKYDDAVSYKAKMQEEGFSDAFVIAMFKGEVISIQEAIELLK